MMLLDKNRNQQVCNSISSISVIMIYLGLLFDDEEKRKFQLINKWGRAKKLTEKVFPVLSLIEVCIVLMHTLKHSLVG